MVENLLATWLRFECVGWKIEAHCYVKPTPYRFSIWDPSGRLVRAQSVSVGGVLILHTGRFVLPTPHARIVELLSARPLYVDIRARRHPQCRPGARREVAH